MEQILECSHCHETNINYFQFGSLDSVRPQDRMNPMFTYEWMPKVPIGFYFKCAKCGKDTVVIPSNYGHREYSQDIPEQIIVRPVFQQPEFSITHYIMYDATGLLDQVVVTQNNTIISLNSKQEVINDGSWHEIPATMFNICKSKGFEEVGLNVQPTNDNVNVESSIGGRQSTEVPTTMGGNVGSATTSSSESSTTNATPTKK